MICTECSGDVRFQTQDGRCVQVCDCGLHVVPTIRGPVSLEPENRVTSARARAPRAYKRVPIVMAAAMRWAYESGEAGITELARQHGVDYTTVYRIVKGESHLS